MFQPGDLVEFKQWDEMEEEFGLNGSSIKCLFSFITNMKHLCGQQYTIYKIVDGKYVYFKEQGRWTEYNISTDMIKHVNGLTYTDLMIG